MRARRQRPDDHAFEEFYKRHVADVYQYALAVLTNPADAEDVTQQTFLNAYRAWQRGERPQVAHNWLIKIAHNVCRMRWRQAGRRPQEVPLADVREPVTIDEDRPDVENVLRALQALPFNQRAAIVMREVEGRSYNEIAEILGTTVASVEALLFRARRRLQAKRKALGVLGTVPLPGSLSSFFGGGGAAAVGGAVVGADVALKAAAVVATGIVAGGVGFKAVKAVAKASPPPPTIAKIRIPRAPLFAANPVKLIVDQRKKTPAREAPLSRPLARVNVDSDGARRSPAGHLISSDGGESATSAGTGAAGGRTGSGAPSAGTTVTSAVSQLPVASPVTTPALPPAPPLSLPPPPTLPVTVTVPTLPTLPPPHP